MQNQQQEATDETDGNIHVITINDWNCKRFHAYNTPNGISYNAVLIIDKFTTLIDTVPAQFAEEFLDQLRQFVSFKDIYYIVIQHAEQESSGCLPMLTVMCPDMRIVCTRKCMEHLLLMYPEIEGVKFELVQNAKKQTRKIEVEKQSEMEDEVKNEMDEDCLNLGAHWLSFRPVPLLHFPEQMVTRVQPCNWLLSSDLFGQALALSHGQYNEAVSGLILEKAEEFAANTFGASATYLAVALRDIMEFNPAYTVPCHGYQLPRVATQAIFKLYQDLLKIIENKDVTPRIAIIYESMWGATERMADFVGNYFKNKGIEVVMADMRLFSLEKLAQESVKCTAFCFGSPTLNNGAMPGIIEAVNYLRGVRLVHGKKAIVFGSYGWGTGEGSKFIQTQLESAGIKVYGRVIWKFNYDRNTEQQMEKLLQDVFGDVTSKAKQK